MSYDKGLQVYRLGLSQIGVGLRLRFVLTMHNNLFALMPQFVYIPVLKIWLRRKATFMQKKMKLTYVKRCEII